MDTTSSSGNSILMYSYRIQLLYDKMLNKIIQKRFIDIRTEQLPVLYAIYKEPKTSQQEIANQLGRDKASITRTIKSLIQKGYITSANCPLDNRKNALKMTPEGNKVINLIQTEMAAYEDTINKKMHAGNNHFDIHNNYELLETICQSYSDSLESENKQYN